MPTATLTDLKDAHMTTIIKQEDLIESVAAALQYISKGV